MAPGGRPAHPPLHVGNGNGEVMEVTGLHGAAQRAQTSPSEILAWIEQGALPAWWTPHGWRMQIEDVAAAMAKSSPTVAPELAHMRRSIAATRRWALASTSDRS